MLIFLIKHIYGKSCCLMYVFTCLPKSHIKKYDDIATYELSSLKPTYKVTVIRENTFIIALFTPHSFYSY